MTRKTGKTVPCKYNVLQLKLHGGECKIYSSFDVRRMDPDYGKNTRFCFYHIITFNILHCKANIIYLLVTLMQSCLLFNRILDTFNSSEKHVKLGSNVSKLLTKGTFSKLATFWIKSFQWKIANLVCKQFEKTMLKLLIVLLIAVIPLVFFNSQGFFHMFLQNYTDVHMGLIALWLTRVVSATVDPISIDCKMWLFNGIWPHSRERNFHAELQLH